MSKPIKTINLKTPYTEEETKIMETILAIAHSSDSLKEIAYHIFNTLNIKKFNVIIDNNGKLNPASELELRTHGMTITDVDTGLTIILKSIQVLKPGLTESEMADVIGYIQNYTDNSTANYSYNRKFYIYD